MYYDCDHLFFREIPEEKWNLVDEYGLSTGFTHGKLLEPRRKFLRWRDFVNELVEGVEITKHEYPNFFRVNGGCIGYSRPDGEDAVHRWMYILDKFITAKNNKRIMQVGDESALFFAINLRQEGWLGEEMSMTRHPYEETVHRIPTGTIAWHFSRAQYRHQDDKRKEVWVNAFMEAVSENFLGTKDHLDTYLSYNNQVDKELLGLECSQ